MSGAALGLFGFGWFVMGFAVCGLLVRCKLIDIS